MEEEIIEKENEEESKNSFSKKILNTTIFNKEAFNRFKNLSDSLIISSHEKIQKIPEEVVIRRQEDTLISVGLRNRGLNIFTSNDSDFVKWMKDFYSVEPELRANKFLVFDTETTHRYNSYAVSFACYLFNLAEDKIEREEYFIINPKEKIHEEAYAVHKISEEEASKYPTFEEYIDTIRPIFEEADVLVGQNLIFDLKVMERELDRLNIPNFISHLTVFDTMTNAKEIVKALNVKGKIKNPKLEESAAFFNVPIEDGVFHNALYDTKITLEVFKHLIRTPV